MPALSHVSAVSAQPAALPPFLRRGDYAAHFAGLAACAPGVALLHRLLLHVDAALAPAERKALYRALWSRVRAADPALRDAAARDLDGRFAALLAWCTEAGWHERATRERLALAHLAGEAEGWQGEHDAAAALALLDDDESDSGTDDAAAWRALRRLQARLAGAGWGTLADAAEAAAMQDTARAAAAAEPALAGAAARALFRLAIAVGDGSAADQLLADCVRQQAHGRLTAEAMAAWLQAGDPEAPPALAPQLQALALRPAALHDAGSRGALLAAFSRPAARQRLAGLETALLAQAAPEAAARPLKPAQAQALEALARLDVIYQAAAEGLAIAEASAPLLAGGTLAPAAVAALRRARALQAVDAGDAETAAMELAHARAADGCPAATALLEQLLRALDADAVQAAADPLDRGDPAAPLLGARWQDEEPLWQALALSGSQPLAAIATHQLAQLYTDGSLQPCATHKRQRLGAARALWQDLAERPAHAAAAEARLGHPTLELLWRHASREGGRDHLWVPPRRPQPAGAEPRLLIVPSCVDSHHSFAQVQALVQGLPQHHLLFVHNPELNWYSDDAFDAVCRLVEQRVLPRFRREQVACYFGSMGGHGALKIAQRFGFRAIVFNPQTDLDLWAAFRPQQRALLWGAERHAQLLAAPQGAFEGSPVYYVVGSGSADREAFALWLARLAQSRNASAIVEKYADPQHPGLIARVVPGRRVAPALLAIDDRLAALQALGDPAGTHAEVPAALAPRLWRQIEQADRLKLELLLRDGRLFVADSVHTGTLPA